MRRVNRVIDVGRVRQNHLSIRQDLGESELIGIPLDAELEHCIANDLRRSLIVREHDGLVEDDAHGLGIVALHCHLDDVKVGRTFVGVTRTRKPARGSVRVVHLGRVQAAVVAAAVAAVAAARAQGDVE